MTCHYCQQPIDDEHGAYRKATGWYRNRARGANELALRTDLDQWCCKGCMSALKAGYDPTQATLL